MTKIRRIVIFRPGALGDFLCAVPVIWRLKETHPLCRIDYISEQHKDQSIINAGIVAELLPEISRVHFYSLDKRAKSRLLELRDSIRPSNEDVLVYLCYRRHSIFTVIRDLLFFRSVGFCNLVGFGPAFLDALWSQIRTREEPEYLRLIRWAKALTDGLVPTVSGSLLVAHEFAEKIWLKFKLHNKVVIAVSPFSKVQAKCWPIERYIAVIKPLLANPKHAVIIIGGYSDLAVATKLSELIGARCYSLAGESLQSSAAMIKRSKLFIGNDSGPMHLAGLLGVPCVAIFSDRDRDALWTPYGNSHVVLRKSLSCGGCMRAICYESPPPCLAAIGADDVLRAAMNQLSETHDHGN